MAYNFVLNPFEKRFPLNSIYRFLEPLVSESLVYFTKMKHVLQAALGVLAA